jgi:Kef-type K+ transport system membrane component KefB
MLTFSTLAVVTVAGLLGPLLAVPVRWHLPVVLGELLAGVALGSTGLRYLHPDEPTFTFLADIGFGLVMFVAGSHVPVRDPRLRGALRMGLGRALAVGLLATGLGFGLAAALDTGHGGLYAVVIASSSAALILPIVDSLGLGGPRVLELLPQVAIADAACVVALPLVVDPSHAGRAAAGAAAVIVAAVAVFGLLLWSERTGLQRRVHRVSESRRSAVELRVSLAVLFGLAALAQQTHVSILLAGFSLGLAVSAVGPPRRLARQLFGLSEGFLGPVFFVWLGASIDLRELGRHPRFILLGLGLGVGALIAHLALRLVGQPVPLGMLAGAQLGVPVAAATVGTQLGVLAPGESAALLLGAVVTIGAAIAGGASAVRAGLLDDRNGRRAGPRGRRPDSGGKPRPLG